MANSTYYYAMPNATDSADLLNFMHYVNNVTGSIFMPIMLGILGIIIFAVGSYQTSASRALAFSAFIISILGMFAAVMGFLAPSYMYLAFLALAGGVVWVILENR